VLNSPVGIDELPRAWYARRAVGLFMLATLVLWVTGAVMIHGLPAGWRTLGFLVAAQGTFFGYCAANRFGYARGYCQAARDREVRRGD